MERVLEASTEIAAPPNEVWRVVSDLSRMPEWSPQTVRMRVFGRARRGAHTVNLNKYGWKVWPTTSTIVRYDENTAIAFRMNENRTTWSYELTPTTSGTTLTERRVPPVGGIPKPVTFLMDKLFGGTQSFDDELTRGMKDSLDKIKAAVER